MAKLFFSLQELYSVTCHVKKWFRILGPVRTACTQSNCASALSDQDLLCPSTELLDAAEFINGQQMA